MNAMYEAKVWGFHPQTVGYYSSLEGAKAQLSSWARVHLYSTKFQTFPEVEWTGSALPAEEEGLVLEGRASAAWPEYDGVVLAVYRHLLDRERVWLPGVTPPWELPREGPSVIDDLIRETVAELPPFFRAALQTQS